MALERKTRMLLLAAALVSVAAATLASVQLMAPGRTPSDPRTLDEAIARIEAVKYDEIAPYLEARFVFHPHTDGIIHARWCDDNNFDKLPKRADGPILIWLAKQTTEKYVRRRTEETHFCYFLTGDRPVGDSPWGAFTQIPWLRGLVEPLLAESKKEYVEILRKLDSRAGTENRAEDPSTKTPVM